MGQLEVKMLSHQAVFILLMWLDKLSAVYYLIVSSIYTLFIYLRRSVGVAANWSRTIAGTLLVLIGINLTTGCARFPVQMPDFSEMGHDVFSEMIKESGAEVHSTSQKTSKLITGKKKDDVVAIFLASGGGCVEENARELSCATMKEWRLEDVSELKLASLPMLTVIKCKIKFSDENIAVEVNVHTGRGPHPPSVSVPDISFACGQFDWCRQGLGFLDRRSWIRP